MHKRPLIIAHRGSMFRAPENTRTAFRLAMSEGADGVELDLRVSRDGELIVLHDATLNRTTNGRGRARSKNLQELKELEVFPGEKIPTLDEVFETLSAPALINVEIKDYDLAGTIVKKMLSVIDRHRSQDRAVVSSFSPIPLWQCKRQDPNIPTALIHFDRYPRKLKSDLSRPLLHPTIAILEHPRIYPEAVAELQKLGYRVWCGNTDQEADMRRVVQSGVEAIITGNPALLHRLLSEKP